jgi:hypothetical protein
LALLLEQSHGTYAPFSDIAQDAESRRQEVTTRPRALSAPLFVLREVGLDRLFVDIWELGASGGAGYLLAAPAQETPKKAPAIFNSPARTVAGRCG